MRMLREHAPPLVREVLAGRPELIEPLLELLLLPLGTHVALLGGTLAVPFAPTQLYAATSLGVVAAHVAIGMKVGGAGPTEMKALARVPRYLLWKAKVLPKVLQAASRQQEWVRTARSTEVTPT